MNFEYIISAGLTIQDYVTLVGVKQKYDAALIDESIDKLIELELIRKMKSKDEYTITSKGSTTLRNCMIHNYLPQYESLYNSLVTVYKLHKCDISGGNQTKRTLAWFKMETGFRDEVIIKIVNHMFRTRELKYIPKLSNLFWRKADMYNKAYDLSNSPIYREFTNHYKLDDGVKLSNDVLTTWMLGVSRLVVPNSNTHSKHSFNGDFKKDKELIDKAKRFVYNKLWG